MDLFEHYHNLPEEVLAIIDKYAEKDYDYNICQDLVDKLEQVGYTCEYDLDAQPYNLRKQTAQDVWTKLGDTPINEDDEIDIDITLSATTFEKGTPIHDIWHWIERTFDIAIHELMFGK